MPIAAPSLLAALLATHAAGEAADPVLLEPPEYHPGRPLRLLAPLPEPEPSDHDRVFVEVLDFDTKVHASPRRDTWGRGVLRRGTILTADPRRGRDGCSSWASLLGGGGVCDGDGVRFLGEPSAPPSFTLSPDISEDLPYRYAKVRAPGTPRLARLPRADELEAIRSGTLPSTLPHQRTEGVVFVAIDRPYDVEGSVFIRTVEGDYIAQEQLVPVTPPATVGQPLIEATLPVAFVVTEDASVFSLGDDARPVPQGVAERTARFAVSRQIIIDDERYLQSDAGLLVRRADTRLAEARPRPSDADPDDKWIHIDLDEQILVAYEGDQPVYVTLVSSGKDGYDTPTGHRRIRRKYISRRMKGPDPDTGTYDIAEVPWAMYYQGGYALHGAYWHDEFGVVRSHGCTNVPPSAARWLFEWTSPRIPEGWHANFEAGTRVVLTRDE